MYFLLSSIISISGIIGISASPTARPYPHNGHAVGCRDRADTSQGVVRARAEVGAPAALSALAKEFKSGDKKALLAKAEADSSADGTAGRFREAGPESASPAPACVEQRRGIGVPALHLEPPRRAAVSAWAHAHRASARMAARMSMRMSMRMSVHVSIHTSRTHCYAQASTLPRS